MYVDITRGYNDSVLPFDINDLHLSQFFMHYLWATISNIILHSFTAPCAYIFYHVNCSIISMLCCLLIINRITPVAFFSVLILNVWQLI